MCVNVRTQIISVHVENRKTLMWLITKINKFNLPYVVDLDKYIKILNSLTKKK